MPTQEAPPFTVSVMFEYIPGVTWMSGRTLPGASFTGRLAEPSGTVVAVVESE